MNYITGLIADNAASIVTTTGAAGTFLTQGTENMAKELMLSGVLGSLGLGDAVTYMAGTNAGRTAYMGIHLGWDNVPEMLKDVVVMPVIKTAQGIVMYGVSKTAMGTAKGVQSMFAYAVKVGKNYFLIAKNGVNYDLIKPLTDLNNYKQFMSKSIMTLGIGIKKTANGIKKVIQFINNEVIPENVKEYVRASNAAIKDMFNRGVAMASNKIYRLCWVPYDDLTENEKKQREQLLSMGMSFAQQIPNLIAASRVYSMVMPTSFNSTYSKISNLKNTIDTTTNQLKIDTSALNESSSKLSEINKINSTMDKIDSVNKQYGTTFKSMNDLDKQVMQAQADVNDGGFLGTSHVRRGLARYLWGESSEDVVLKNAEKLKELTGEELKAMDELKQNAEFTEERLKNIKLEAKQLETKVNEINAKVESGAKLSTEKQNELNNAQQELINKRNELNFVQRAAVDAQDAVLKFCSENPVTCAAGVAAGALGGYKLYNSLSEKNKERARDVGTIGRSGLAIAGSVPMTMAAGASCLGGNVFSCVGLLGGLANTTQHAATIYNRTSKYIPKRNNNNNNKTIQEKIADNLGEGIDDDEIDWGYQKEEDKEEVKYQDKLHTELGEDNGIKGKPRSLLTLKGRKRARELFEYPTSQ